MCPDCQGDQRGGLRGYFGSGLDRPKEPFTLGGNTSKHSTHSQCTELSGGAPSAIRLPPLDDGHEGTTTTAVSPALASDTPIVHSSPVSACIHIHTSLRSRPSSRCVLLAPCHFLSLLLASRPVFVSTLAPVLGASYGGVDVSCLAWGPISLLRNRL